MPMREAREREPYEREPYEHEKYELAVIGAGPAGLAAALAAADDGVRVALLDAAPEAGGQFYRQPAKALYARRPQRLYHAWSTWARLRARLEAHVAAGRISFLSDRHVWHVEHGGGLGDRGLGDRGFAVHALTGPGQRTSETVTATALVLATGGYERVLPFPGWTLPGVLTAGGAQAMLKAGLVLPGRRVVVAGSGPLLLPVATSLAAAGARIAGLYESAAPRGFAPHASAVLANPAKLAEGARYAAELARHGVRVRFRHTVIRAHGTDRVEAVTVARLDGDGRVIGGTERRVACDALAVSHGMLPHTEIAQALGARVTNQGTLVDAEQRTDVPNLWAAGEATGIGGATLALAEGELAGRSVAARLRGGEPDPTYPAWRSADRARTRLRAFADVIESAYPAPADWVERVEDDTVVCRCEEVPASAVREAAAELGATDLRTVKLITRAGMGWCQGRICGPGVAGVAGCPAAPVRAPFARPVPLGVLAEESAAESAAQPAARPAAQFAPDSDPAPTPEEDDEQP